jgi:hopene-associated glycosyltransferase HpnB
MPSVLVLATGLSLLIWLYLVLFHGRFWRGSERLTPASPTLSTWPVIAAVVPARDEADVIARSLGSILTQDYPGRLQVFLVDDHSSDGTAQAAREAAARLGQDARLSIVTARDLPPGWTGKLWAMSEGLAQAHRGERDADYIWLSDADIAYDPDTLRHLVTKAELERRDLVSLMAALFCQSAWERLLIPPFIYFFQMLYPFPWSNDPARRTAAAAGGCMLVRATALRAIGGVEAIKGALIDDCALARRLKDLTLRGDPAAAGGGIWLGLATGARSIRPYRGLGDIWRMVARSAYTQLRHQPALLAGTLAGMILVYLVPVLSVLLYPWHGAPAAASMGAAAWLLMAVSAWPTFRLYGQAPWRALTLPIAATLYGIMTFDSARRHWLGRGGVWKGRVSGALARRQSDL